MRLAWLLLLFPSLAFAVAGCPIGVQLGNVTIATRLPVCLKFDSSQLGGCEVNCKGVCVELPLANTKGPVETTGTACNYTENGSGNGDSDGSGNTPDEGPAGTKPIAGWLDFEPVIGDATGTSVSGAVAKLNKNLGLALRQVVDSNKQDSGNLNSIAHSAESLSRDMKEALYHIKQSSSELSHVNGNLGGVAAALSTTRDYLQSIDVKMNNLGSASGATGTGGNLSKEFEDKLFGTLDAMRYGSLNNIDFKMSDVKGHLAGIEGALGANGMAGNIYAMRQMMEQMSSGSSGGSTGGGSTGGQTGGSGQSEQYLKDMSESIGYMAEDVLSIRKALDGSGNGSGDGIDYSQMPGSGTNPLTVGAAHYNSACAGGDCFFDVAAIQKKLDDANKAISDKYKDIGDEVKEMFDFKLSGSAGIMECFDFFTYGGKDYRVCPPAKEYWDIIAALMMFIFYFIAFAIVFKR
ncbi:hypothetical protein GL273_06755 [Aeromonas jandaei]|uniref:hypothetical protein n=1 Tax=Aeromonas jandaei TaxID=650 RepID=UPI001C5B23D7|nr:hypothetical protein [Aeromonas jandaei]MBW3805525.1 hypothetical protein [Aeromonas jandaei]